MFFVKSRYFRFLASALCTTVLNGLLVLKFIRLHDLPGAKPLDDSFWAMMTAMWLLFFAISWFIFSAKDLK